MGKFSCGGREKEGGGTYSCGVMVFRSLRSAPAQKALSRALARIKTRGLRGAGASRMEDIEEARDERREEERALRLWGDERVRRVMWPVWGAGRVVVWRRGGGGERVEERRGWGRKVRGSWSRGRGERIGWRWRVGRFWFGGGDGCLFLWRGWGFRSVIGESVFR